MDVLDKVTHAPLREMIKLCRQEVPGFELRFKNESAWMKFLNFFAQLFNPAFMTRYTTTTGSTVYFPTEAAFLETQAASAEILAHELVHMVERKKEGLVLNFLRYAFPQILAVLALVSIAAIWSLWFLLALVFLLVLVPLPAPGRRDIELNGYTMTMAVDYWTTGAISDSTFEFIARQFTGSAYYFMWPWHADIMHRIKMRAQAIRTNEVLRDPLYAQVRDAFRAS